jgi:hypothetical protein
VDGVGLEVHEVRAPVLAPLLGGPAGHHAHGVPLAPAALLDTADAPPVAVRQVPAGEAAERPAHGLRGQAEVRNVRGGFIGLLPDGLREVAGRLLRASRHGLVDHQPLQLVQASARPVPLLLALPRKGGLEGLGHAPAVRVAEARQDRSRRRQAQALDELLPEQPQLHHVEDHRALAAEAERPPLRLELQQLPKVEILRAHRRLEMRGHRITLRRMASPPRAPLLRGQHLGGRARAGPPIAPDEALEEGRSSDPG